MMYDNDLSENFIPCVTIIIVNNESRTYQSYSQEAYSCCRTGCTIIKKWIFWYSSLGSWNFYWVWQWQATFKWRHCKSDLRSDYWTYIQNTLSKPIEMTATLAFKMPHCLT